MPGDLLGLLTQTTKKRTITFIPVDICFGKAAPLPGTIHGVTVLGSFLSHLVNTVKKKHIFSKSCSIPGLNSRGDFSLPSHLSPLQPLQKKPELLPRLFYIQIGSLIKFHNFLRSYFILIIDFEDINSVFQIFQSVNFKII